MIDERQKETGKKRRLKKIDKIIRYMIRSFFYVLIIIIYFYIIYFILAGFGENSSISLYKSYLVKLLQLTFISYGILFIVLVVALFFQIWNKN